MRRSRSTISGAPPACRSATTSSSTGRTWSRRRPRASRPIPPPALGGCARPGAGRSSQSDSASADAIRGWRRRQVMDSPVRSGSTAGRVLARTARRGRHNVPAKSEAPILGLMGGADEGIPVEQVRDLRAGACGRRCRAGDRRLRRRPAQLLRPQAGGVRGRVGRCVEPRGAFIERQRCLAQRSVEPTILGAWSRRSSCSMSRSSLGAGTTSPPTCRTRRSPCCIRAPASRSGRTTSRRSSRWR